jgi:parallel beta-helix repeat protein
MRHLLRCALPLVALSSCSGHSSSSGANAGDPSSCTVTVAPGADDQSSVQGALLAAKPGDVVCIGPGHYAFTDELSLAIARVTVRGVGSPVLDFSGQKGGANAISISADGALVEDLEVDDPAGDGVRATAVDGITMRNLTVRWTRGPNTANGGYALYPVQSNHVLVDGCTASGASDTGIYVGQSKNIVVRNNKVSECESGIEIENSTDADVYGNDTINNVGGILVFDLPGLPFEPPQGAGHAKVHDNHICGNNLPPFAPQGNVVNLVPQGTGILVVASDDNEIAGNVVCDNESVGISVDSWAIANQPANDPTYDQVPDGNWVHDNTLTHNGYAPQGPASFIAAGFLKSTTVPSLTWDGVTDPKQAGAQYLNCFTNNVATDFADFDFAGQGAHASTDIGPFTCMHTALPAIDPTGFPGQ